jgi:hypothetical protein
MHGLLDLINNEQILAHCLMVIHLRMETLLKSLRTIPKKLTKIIEKQQIPNKDYSRPLELSIRTVQLLFGGVAAACTLRT